MKKIFRIIDEAEENYNQKETSDSMLEKAFKEGCEHGYKKALKEMEGYSERKPHMYNEGFEEKIEKLKRKYV